MFSIKPIVCGALILAAAPTHAHAQLKENAEDFVKDVLWALFGPNWNLSAHAGTSNHGRFMLQRVPTGGGAVSERVLRAEGGFSVGVGAGVDILLRAGARIGYTYSSTNLVFRTDNGDGSGLLDVDDAGQMKSHAISFEIMRYLLPAQAPITPYATAGIVGVWWALNDDVTMLDASEGTQFRGGGQGVVGLKVKVSDKMDARFEVASASVRNPFTGSESYRVLAGTTIDEPTRVSRSGLRFSAVYNFGKPDVKLSKPKRTARRR